MRIRWIVVLAISALTVSAGGPAVRAQGTRPVDTLKKLSGLSPAAHMDALVKGAQVEGGQVVWFVGRDLREVAEMVKAFEAKYPFMKVEYVRAGDQAAQRVLTEFRAGTASTDLIDLNAGEVYQLMQANALASYVSPEAAKIPDEFKDKNGYWAAVDVLPEIVAFNTRLVKAEDVPRTFAGLADPKWKGKLGRTTIGGPRWIAGMMKFYGERRGLEMVRAVARNDVRLYTSNTALGVQLAQGEINIAFDLHITVPLAEKRRGAPIDFTATEPVVFADPSLIAITAASRHPLGAALLYSWLFSREGQERVAQITGGARMSTRTDVDYAHRALLRGRQFVIYGPDITGPQFNKLLDLFREIFIR